jgi:signal peptidase I
VIRRDHLTNLWTPLLVLAVATVPYVIFVQYSPSASEPAFAAIQLFAAAMACWYAGLLVWHGVRRKPPPAAQEPSESRRSVALGFAKYFAIALAFRALVAEPYLIPSSSMLPTLEIGDFVFINKFLYGVRIPWINRVLFPIVRRPSRGDVVVFNNPLIPDKDFIKRVVGVPGDRVEVINQVVHLNGVLQSRTSDGETTVSDQDREGRWQSFELHQFQETLGEVTHPVLQYPGGRAGDFGPVTVPEGSVFVMGDNRDNSSDSRFGFGVSDQAAFVPYGHIKGKAVLIWLSLSHGGWGKGLFGGTGLRVDRALRVVR